MDSISRTSDAPHTLPVSDENVLIIDIPFGTTADDAQRLLNEPYGRGFYIHRTLEWIDGIRVVYVHRAKSAVKTVSNPQTREATAMQFMRDNREMSANQLSVAFKALGFPRSAPWISKKRIEVVRLERRVS